MENNNLIQYKDNIFTKIRSFFKKIFSRKKKVNIENDKQIAMSNFQIKEETNGNLFYNNHTSNNFIENIVIPVDGEEKRLKNLQRLYDNGEIEEEDISDEDMDKLIEMYEKETEILNEDTELRKIHISRMLNELKNA